MDDGGVSADASPRSTEVDQVAAARDWLRRHGVDPEDQPSDAVAARRVVGEPSTESGYARSRRSPAAGSIGRSLSRRRRDTGGGSEGGEEAGGDHPGGSASPGRRGAEPDVDPEEVARGIVLRKLAVQPRTRVELERALVGQEVPEEAAGAVLDRLTEVGLVDDVTFAHDWVTSRQQRRHLSKTALRRELQSKGVDRDVIDGALADVEGADEHSAALDLARRRVATMSGLARDVAYRRLAGVLARRGFSSSLTARVLAEVLDGSGAGE